MAVSDTVADLEELLQCLHSIPANSSKLDHTFLKMKSNKPRSPKEQRLAREQALHKHLSTVVLPSLESEESPYFTRMSRFTSRRYNILKKRDKEARLATVAAERAAAKDLPDGSGAFRSTTRLRRTTRQGANGYGYDESARDDELERALRESERDTSRKRRISGSDYEEPDYAGMVAENDGQDEEAYEYDIDDESQENGRTRKSTRRITAKPKKPTIPGERRSLRARPKPESRESSVEVIVESKPVIVRSYSPEHEPPPIRFGGLEEVWSKGRYLGYYALDGSLVKAKKGDMPLYKLAKLGFPMPDISGPAKIDADTSGISGESLPGSAVPTLEMENGDENRGSPSSTIEADDNRDRSEASSPGMTVTSSTFVVAKPKADDFKTSVNGGPSKSRVEVVVS